MSAASTTKRLCTICARGGSKGVKDKNLRDLAGIPLIAHSILQAKDSGLFAAIAVSSDSSDILHTAERYGAHCLVERPLDLATDHAPKLPAIKHCIESAEKMMGKMYDVTVDLDATSPLRLPEDIIQAVALLETSGVSNVITGMPARRSPYFNLVELNAEGQVRLSKPPATAVFRRQDSPKCYDLNASIYVWRRSAVAEHFAVLNDDTMLYIMPEERSIDVDSELDFEFVRFVMERRAAK